VSKLVAGIYRHWLFEGIGLALKDYLLAKDY
jgi:hypothetical protein